MNLMCHVIDNYKCTVCNQDTLFFMTKYGSMIDYYALIKRGMSLEQIENLLREKNVTKIKCMNCNREYYMDFREKYPKNIDTKDLIGLLK